MFKPNPYERLTLAERLRTEGGRRAAALGLALLLEAILILLLLTLGDEGGLGTNTREILSTFDASDAEDAPEPETPPEPQQAQPPAAQAQPQPQPEESTTPQTAPAPPAVLLPRDIGPKVDIQQLPRVPATPAPARPPMGPPAPRAGRNDTPVVGRRANGEPVYAAQWYREPTDQELAGYVSTMRGPGWGLIECRTAPNFRVEDCEFLREYPDGSNIGRAFLQAAWQFKVRPPRKGNSYLVGEWVRIRFTLDMSRPAPNYSNN